MDITDTAASASCVKYSTSITSSLSVLDKIQHVAKMRVGLTRFSLTLVVSLLFWDITNNNLKFTSPMAFTVCSSPLGIVYKE